MPQIKGSCGHFKALWDTHPTCISCSYCSRSNNCKFCVDWSIDLWKLVDSRRTYREKMAKKKVSSTGQKSGFSCRSSQKTLNATDSEEIYGTDDCSGDDVHGVSEHPRSSTSRSAATGPQQSGLDRSSGQGNSHRSGASLSPNRSKRGSSKKIVSQSSSGQDVSELFLPDTGHSLVTGRCQNSPDTRLPDRSVSEIIPGTDRNISGQSSQDTGSKDKSRKSTAHGTGHNRTQSFGRFRTFSQDRTTCQNRTTGQFRTPAE